jgi:hypothetical protein
MTEETQRDEAEKEKLRQETREREEDNRTRYGVEMTPDQVREAKDYTYTPQGHLEIPDEVSNEFKNKGFGLRWVRYMLEGGIDTRNWTKQAREGWTPVNPSEVASNQVKYMGIENQDQLGDVIAKGDLILCKNEMYKIKARQEYFENKASEQIEGVNERLRDQGMSKLAELTGEKVHYNKSSSRTMVGANSRKGLDFGE